MEYRELYVKVDTKKIL